MHATGFVLAGGQSSRMGYNKARLKLNSHLLIEEVAAKLKNVAGNVAVVGPPERYSDLKLECLPDKRPGLGPLAGIEAALETRRAELNLILACDMPEIPETWLRHLLRISRESAAPCVLTRDGTGKLHPLCAVYRTSCLEAVRSALDEGRLKLIDLIRDLNAMAVDSGDVIRNINTLADWKAYRERPT